MFAKSINTEIYQKYSCLRIKKKKESGKRTMKLNTILNDLWEITQVQCF
jgi:hypothetical protein